MKTAWIISLCFISLFASAQNRYGNAELFIQIRDQGEYRVSVNDEMIASRSGKFRFFDLYPGRNAVSVFNGGKLVFKADLTLRDGIRSMVVYNRRDGLKIYDDLKIYRNGVYVLDNWSGSLNNDRNYPDQVYAMEMDQMEFNRLLNALRKESFDSDRVKFLVVALQQNRISVNQLTLLLKAIEFDSGRLKAAINSYNSVCDKRNFYMIRELFTFSSDKAKLDDFLLKAAPADNITDYK